MQHAILFMTFSRHSVLLHLEWMGDCDSRRHVLGDERGVKLTRESVVKSL